MARILGQYNDIQCQGCQAQINGTVFRIDTTKPHGTYSRIYCSGCTANQLGLSVRAVEAWAARAMANCQGCTRIVVRRGAASGNRFCCDRCLNRFYKRRSRFNDDIAAAPERYCLHCNEEFSKKRKGAMFCRDSCRAMAASARKLAREKHAALHFLKKGNSTLPPLQVSQQIKTT
jgi:hypothetical protein